MTKTYYIEFVRIEHNVYRGAVVAETEQEAQEIFMDTLNWDDYETVHADEYFEVTKEA